MRVGVVGSGEVGTTLAAGCQRHGHSVTPAFLHNEWSHAFKLLRA